MLREEGLYYLVNHYDASQWIIGEFCIPGKEQIPFWKLMDSPMLTEEELINDFAIGNKVLKP